ncbi:hypothetical protein JLBYU07_82 [Escherichia phage JLBYU07]|nr:hypothetical protein JLBYU07_82 [Escherichia phage JLBYU07]
MAHTDTQKEKSPQTTKTTRNTDNKKKQIHIHK